MKKILSMIVLSVLAFSPATSLAASIKVTTDDGVVTIIPTQENYMSVGEIINFVFSGINDTPKSYKYIKLNFKDVKEGTVLYDSLQKAVYLDKVENVPTYLHPEAPANEFIAYSFIKVGFGVDLIGGKDVKELKSKKVTKTTLLRMKSEFSNADSDSLTEEAKVEIKKQILDQVIKKVEESHVDSDKFTMSELYDGAISGALAVTEDKYSVYFPPEKNKTFKDSLNGKFEGIGSYVDMPRPGEFILTKPIKNGPAFLAGIKAGDRVLEVDGKKVTKDVSSKEIVSWLKGPKGTKVKIKIQRDTKILNFEIERDVVVEPAIETKIFGIDTYYIRLVSFNDHIAKEFEKSLEEIRDNKRIKRIILDLRGNGGGYLNQVSEMLNYFVPAGEGKVIVDSVSGSEIIRSAGNRIIYPQNYKIHIMVDEGTASASEIFVGTIKDYYKNAVIFGKKSYGKGVVQTIIPFFDGSSFKYTTAKWFTGKTKSSINMKGITPDEEVDFDLDLYKKDGVDSQLQYVIKY